MSFHSPLYTFFVSILSSDHFLCPVSTKENLKRLNQFYYTIKMEDVDLPPSFSEYISGVFGPAVLLAWSFKRMFPSNCPSLNTDPTLAVVICVYTV